MTIFAKKRLELINPACRVWGMNTPSFLACVIEDAFVPFEYYRNGPIPMHKLKPGFIFQACVDKALEQRQVVSVEVGLGDHCMPDTGIALQLKTTTGVHPGADSFVFCRAEGFGANFIEERCKFVEDSIFNMFGQTGTSRFVLSHVNLTTKGIAHYLLFDEGKPVGDWLKPENIGGTQKQSHFKVKFSKMVPLKN
jgi:hypothetical protein